MTNRRTAALAGALLALAIASCGSPDEAPTKVSSTESPSTITASPPARTSAVYAISSFNRISNRSQAVVIGTVTNVSDPRWNSPTGEKWEGVTERVGPQQSYDVSVAVEEVILSTDELKAVVGETIKIRVIGLPPGPDDDPGVVDPEQELYGRYTEGERILVNLLSWNQPLNDGTTERVNASLGLWTIIDDGGRRYGVNLDERWDGPLDSIIRRFHEERAHGEDPSRDAGDRVELFPPDERRRQG